MLYRRLATPRNIAAERLVKAGCWMLRPFGLRPSPAKPAPPVV